MLVQKNIPCGFCGSATAAFPLVCRLLRTSSEKFVTLFFFLISEGDNLLEVEYDCARLDQAQEGCVDTEEDDKDFTRSVTRSEPPKCGQRKPRLAFKTSSFLSSLPSPKTQPSFRCYCSGELCNGSARFAPAATVVAAAAVAVAAKWA